VAAQLAGLDLGGGHGLTRIPELALKTELLLGALAELRRDVSVAVLAAG
jgi:hypothetical protein